MAFKISPNDPRIHVFSVSDGDVKLDHQTYLSRLSEDGHGMPLADALGAKIDATYAEVFAVRDVEPMGLRSYLGQAHDIPDDELAPDAARLDGLSGDVVVLAPRAVEGLTELDPLPELTHIGSYAPAEADNSPRDLPPAVKEPRLAEPELPAPPRGLSRGVIAGVIVVALILAAVLILI